MGQGDTHFGGNQTQMMAAKGGPIVGIEALGDAKSSDGHHQITQETFSVFRQMKLRRYDISRGVIENGVKIGFAGMHAIFDHGSMKKIGAPEVAEMRIFKGSDAFAGIISDVAVESLCGGKAIDGGPARLTAIPYALAQQFAENTFDGEPADALCVARLVHRVATRVAL